MKIICIGRNYTKHIEELQNERPTEPVIFMKPDSAILLKQHARDIQTECKLKGLPWEKAKAFDGSAVIGEFVSKTDYNSLENLTFELTRNGKTVQKGNTSHMLWKIDELISYVSQYFTLKIGDIIFTGTPEGVGLVEPEDFLEGFLEGTKLFRIQVK